MNHELAGMIFAMTGFAILAIVFTVLARQVMLIMRERTRTNATLAELREQRRLADELATAQRETAQALTRLEEVEQRLATVERMLREVDEPVLAR